MRFEARLEAYRAAVEAELEKAMGGCAAPEPLLSSMRYSLLAGGKRLRPVMLLAACEMAGGDAQNALPFAAAVEMIHTYSLIHDDLPAMDDDDVRRGRPTNHKVYGEGMAVLAGDGLLSLAAETLLGAADSAEALDAARRVMRGAGVLGMVAGQCVDLRCERACAGGADEVAYVHLHKTADMFVGAVTAGLALAGASEAQKQSGARFAEALGVAFQIRDDLLNRNGDAAALGKATGTDAARGKLTWPAVFGAEASERAVAEKMALAKSALAVFGEASGFLRELSDRLIQRTC